MKKSLIVATCLVMISGAAFAQGAQPPGYTGLPIPPGLSSSDDTWRVSSGAGNEVQATRISRSRLHKKPRAKSHH